MQSSCHMIQYTFYLITVLSLLRCANSSSFTFELTSGDTSCFYAFLQENEQASIEFQVVAGGNYDVDVSLRDPFKNVVTSLHRSQYDFFNHTAKIAGDYELCFGNEFSTVTHKIVFMEWILGSQTDESVAFTREYPLTMMDNEVRIIHLNLNRAVSEQMKVRLQEASSRSFLEALNDRVTWGSIIHVTVIVVVSVGQVCILRSFFNAPSVAFTSRTRVVLPTAGY